MKWFRYILVILCTISSSKIKATHFVGSDITYRCLDANGNYEITLIIYRDCGPGTATFCSPTCANIGSCVFQIEVWGADPSCSNTRFSTLNCAGVSVRDINPNPRCPTAKTTCDNLGCVTPGTLTPGIERYEFKGTINIGPSSGIPASCCNIRFAYSNCCRNNIIGNITPGSFYTDAIVNRCIATYPDCNSPDLTNDPYAVLCSGQGFIFNNGAFDPDLDSLVYSFTSSLESNGVQCTYVAPYQPQAPMPYTPPLNGSYPSGIVVDPIYGDVKFRPNLYPFVGVVAVKIEQWRKVNNSLAIVGVTRREIQMYVKFCDPNNPPTLITIPSGVSTTKPKTFYETHVGEQICFDIIAKDTDFNLPSVSDTTYLTWNRIMENFGATFTPNYLPNSRKTQGPREDNYKVCWTPSISHLKNGNPTKYNFSIKAIDSRCPYPGIIAQGFTINVLPGVLPLSISISNTCGTYKLSHSQPIQSYSSKKWRVSLTKNIFDTLNLIQSDSQNFNLRFTKAGKYPIQLFVALQGSNLTSTFYDTITVTKVLNTTNDTSYCDYPNSLRIESFNTDTSFKKLQWFLSPDTLNAIDTTTQFYYLVNKPSKIILRAYDTSKTCYYSDTLNINVAKLKAGVIEKTSNQQCLNSNNFIFINSTRDTFNNPYSVKWRNSIGDSLINKDTITYKFTSQTSVTLKLLVSNSFGCSDSMTKNINVWNNPKAAFSLSNDSIQCLKNNVFNFSNLSTPGIDSNSYNWSFGNGFNSTQKNPVYSYPSVGNYTVKLLATNTKNCKDSITHNINIKPSPSANIFVNNNSQCLNNNNYLFIDSSNTIPGLLSRSWKIDNINYFTPTVSYKFLTEGIYSAMLVIRTTNNCADTAVKNIQVLSSPKAGFTINKDTQCFNLHSFEFRDTSKVTNGNPSRNWIFGENTSDTSSLQVVLKSYKTPNNYTIKLVSLSNSGCSDTVTKMIVLNHSPKAGFATNKLIQCLSSNQFICQDTSKIESGILSRNWEYENVINDSNKYLNIHFKSDGIFPVKLKVVSNNFCIDSISQDLKVLTSPLIGFEINKDSQCLSSNLFTFRDTSRLMNGILTRLWNFGESINDTSSLINNTKVYSAAKSYQIKLRAASNSGCMDSLVKIILVSPSPLAGVITGPSSNLMVNTPYLYNINQQLNHSYDWKVSNGNIITGQGTNAVTVQWISNGNGYLTAIIKNNSNCTDSSKLNVGIGINNQPNITSFIPISGKTGDTISIIGNNFQGTNSVTFGGTAASSFNILSNNLLKAIVANGSSGSVSLTTPDGTTFLNGFTYIPSTSLFQIKPSDRLLIIPNPTSSMIEFLNSDINYETSSIVIRDVLGRNIKTILKGSRKIFIEDLTSGTYLIILNTGDKTYFEKVIKE